MAKTYNKQLVGVKPTSIALFEGAFAAVLGLVVAVLYSLNTTIDIAESTNNVLAGLTLGIAAGAVGILIVPLVYFGIGWVVGLLHGVVLNFLVESIGGISVEMRENK